MTTWSTACPDWEQRIVERQTLIPFGPIFEDEAEAALEVFKSLRIVDLPGHPTFGEVSEPWVFEFVSAIFGAYDAETGRRLIREFFLLISKKNTKSTIAAGIMVTALIRNWRHSAELMILAPTIEIANNSYKPAADMIRHDPELAELMHIQDHQRSITHRTTGASLKVIAADSDTVSGKKASFILIDELWIFGKRGNADSMLREATGGLVSRPEGFVIYLSTHADEPPAGVFKDKLDYFRDVRDGKITDRKSLGVLYEWPRQLLEDEAYRDPDWFYVTNPNIGRSVDREWLEDEYRKLEARDADMSEWQVFFAKHLNVEIGGRLSRDGWAGATYWVRGEEPGLTLDAVLERSEVCIVGVDGGGLDDLYGVSVLGRERETRRWLHWGHALISPEGMERRKANGSVYRDFMKDGDLTLVEGLPDDLDWIVDLTARVRDAGLLSAVGVDPAGYGGIVEALAKIGVTEEAGLLKGVGQGIRLMGAAKTVERKLVDGTFRHGGSRLMAWCAGNAKVKQTSTAMMIERAGSGFGKIDPLMALFDAAALMALNPEPQNTTSFWEAA